MGGRGRRERRPRGRPPGGRLLPGSARGRGRPRAAVARGREDGAGLRLGRTLVLLRRGQPPCLRPPRGLLRVQQVPGHEGRAHRAADGPRLHAEEPAGVRRSERLPDPDLRDRGPEAAQPGEAAGEAADRQPLRREPPQGFRSHGHGVPGHRPGEGDLRGHAGAVRHRPLGERHARGVRLRRRHVRHRAAGAERRRNADGLGRGVVGSFGLWTDDVDALAGGDRPRHAARGARSRPGRAHPVDHPRRGRRPPGGGRPEAA